MKNFLGQIPYSQVGTRVLPAVGMLTGMGPDGEPIVASPEDWQRLINACQAQSLMLPNEVRSQAIEEFYFTRINQSFLEGVRALPQMTEAMRLVIQALPAMQGIVATGTMGTIIAAVVKNAKPEATVWTNVWKSGVYFTAGTGFVLYLPGLISAGGEHIKTGGREVIEYIKSLRLAGPDQATVTQPVASISQLPDSNIPLDRNTASSSSAVSTTKTVTHSDSKNANPLSEKSYCRLLYFFPLFPVFITDSATDRITPNYNSGDCVSFFTEYNIVAYMMTILVIILVVLFIFLGGLGIIQRYREKLYFVSGPNIQTFLRGLTTVLKVCVFLFSICLVLFALYLYIFLAIPVDMGGICEKGAQKMHHMSSHYYLYYYVTDNTTVSEFITGTGSIFCALISFYRGFFLVRSMECHAYTKMLVTFICVALVRCSTLLLPAILKVINGENIKPDSYTFSQLFDLYHVMLTTIFIYILLASFCYILVIILDRMRQNRIYLFERYSGTLGKLSNPNFVEATSVILKIIIVLTVSLIFQNIIVVGMHHIPSHLIPMCDLAMESMRINTGQESIGINTINIQHITPVIIDNECSIPLFFESYYNTQNLLVYLLVFAMIIIATFMSIQHVQGYYDSENVYKGAHWKTIVWVRDILLLTCYFFAVVLSCYLFFFYNIDNNITIICNDVMKNFRGLTGDYYISHRYFNTPVEYFEKVIVTIAMITLGFYRSYILIKPKAWGNTQKTIFIFISGMITRKIVSYVTSEGVVKQKLMAGKTLFELFDRYNEITLVIIFFLIMTGVCFIIAHFSEKWLVKQEFSTKFTRIMDVFIVFIKIIVGACFLCVSVGAINIYIFELPSEYYNIMDEAIKFAINYETTIYNKEMALSYCEIGVINFAMCWNSSISRPTLLESKNGRR